MTPPNDNPPAGQPDHEDAPAKPDEVDPKTGTDPDDIPIDNPSG